MRSLLLSSIFACSIAGASAQWGQIGGSLFGSYFGVPLTNATFDYVIVGGGLAGLTVASRLAENKSLSIAVVEPGSFYEISNGNLSQIPLYSEQYVSKDPSDVQPLIDWELLTTPQPQLNDQIIHYAQGRCLGGSSARNQMIYHRGTVGSYNWWGDLVGDQGFAWSGIFPYFKKSINFTTPNDAKRAPNTTSISYLTSAYNSSAGPVHVSFPNFGSPISTYAQPAFKAAGFPVAQDFVSGKLNGSQWNPLTIDPKDQTRSSSETSFLRESLNAGSKLKLYTNTKAMNIIFDGNKTATGVNVTTLGQAYQLTARREVIVSAGAFHSPQLLMVSGIGPAATLKKYNITVVSDLPGVGQNMHDSCNVGGVSFPVNLISPSTITTNATALAAATYEYLHNQTGFLTNPGGDFLNWEKLPAAYRANLSASALADLSVFPADWPEIEYVVNSDKGSLQGAATSVSNSATIGILLIAATSRGNITIRSASMDDKPVISTNWLQTKTDQEVAVQAYRRSREVWTYMSNITAGPESLPGANYTTDEQILSYIQSTGISAIHHATSTNMMGRKNESMAVVNSHGRVFGVQNLRVIDSSSFRFTPPGHTQGATYAHAEKLVDDIEKGY